MVVSGLPIRNGDRHAGEIASMALHMIRTIKRFEIKHRRGEPIKLRIGIHSGSNNHFLINLLYKSINTRYITNKYNC